MACVPLVPQTSLWSQTSHKPLEKAVENVTYPKLLFLLHSPVNDWNLQREPKGIQYPNPIDFKWVWDTRIRS